MYRNWSWPLLSNHLCCIILQFEWHAEANRHISGIYFDAFEHGARVNQRVYWLQLLRLIFIYFIFCLFKESWSICLPVGQQSVLFFFPLACRLPSFIIIFLFTVGKQFTLPRGALHLDNTKRRQSDCQSLNLPNKNQPSHCRLDQCPECPFKFAVSGISTERSGFPCWSNISGSWLQLSCQTRHYNYRETFFKTRHLQTGSREIIGILGMFPLSLFSHRTAAFYLDSCKKSFQSLF